MAYPKWIFRITPYTSKKRQRFSLCCINDYNSLCAAKTKKHNIAKNFVFNYRKLGHIKMMQKILTIIIPTSNMENYLRKCLSSIIVDDKDLMELLEVLVVNDGSTDRSSEIAHSYESQYPETFCVIDKENGNYGSCVNRGLKEATGKYIKVLDADDYYDTDVLASFIHHLHTTDADVIFNFAEQVDANGRILGNFGMHPTRYYEHIKVKQDITLNDLIEVRELRPQMHNLTYKRTILNRINYRQLEGVSYSDTQWRIIPMAFVETIEVFPHALYKYFIGRTGQTVSNEHLRTHFNDEQTVILHTIHECYNIKNEGIGKEYAKHAILGFLNYLYEYGVNDEVFKESDIRSFDTMLKEQSPWHWKQMETCKIKITQYRHSVSIPFWRKNNGRWFYMLEHTFAFFWDPYKKVKAKIINETATHNK